MTMKALIAGSLAFFAATSSASAEPGAGEAPPPRAEPAPKPKAPYSLPWQLRSAGVGNVARLDTTFAVHDDGGDAWNETLVTMVTLSYKVAPWAAPVVRLGYVVNAARDAEGNAQIASAFANPVIGMMFAPKLPDPVKLSLFFGNTLPIGEGGGDAPAPEKATAMQMGSLTRSGMDGSMFSPNYIAFVPGADLAYVAYGLTVQGELTLIQYFRTRGEENPKSADAARTAAIAAMHVGYFFVPAFSVGADLRYQFWVRNPSVPDDAVARDNFTVAAGARVHVPLGPKAWFRPGLSYGCGIDNPMRDSHYNMIQLDLPFSF